MNTSIRARRAERGFSFVELLVTIIIATIAFAAMVPLFVSTTKANSLDKVRLQAVNVAQDKIEKIRQLDYDLIRESNLEGTGDPTKWKYSAEFGPTWKSDRGRVYGVSYVVDEVSDVSSHTLYKRVSVTVDWTAPPARAPNSFEKSPGYDPVTKHGYGVTLRTFIYKQYAGPQIVDLFMTPDTFTGVLDWDPLPTGAGTLTIEAVISPQDDAMAKYVQFKGYGASAVPVLDAKVTTKVSRFGNPVRFGVTWTPKTDGSQDGLYRFEATAYSTSGLPGNSYSEEFRLETGRPPAPVVTARPGNTKVDLTWVSPAADVASYTLSRSTGIDSEDFSFSVTVSTTGYTDSGLVNGTTYNYKVVASDAGGVGPASAVVPAVPFVPPDRTPPPAPSDVISVPTVQKAVLTWHDVPDTVVTGEPTTGTFRYNVYRDGGLTPCGFVGSPEGELAGEVVTWSENITDGLSHTYAVSSVDVALNESLKSASVTVPYLAPPNYTLILTSTKNADYTVTDSVDNVVGTAKSTNHTFTLPAGSYKVSAKWGSTTIGPTPVQLDRNGVSYNFVF